MNIFKLLSYLSIWVLVFIWAVLAYHITGFYFLGAGAITKLFVALCVSGALGWAFAKEPLAQPRLLLVFSVAVHLTAAAWPQFSAHFVQTVCGSWILTNALVGIGSHYGWAGAYYDWSAPRRSSGFFGYPQSLSINPSTGIPMTSGGVDSGGNPMGSGSSNHHHR